MKIKQWIQLIIATCAFVWGCVALGVSFAPAQATDANVGVSEDAAIRLEEPTGVRFFGELEEDCVESLTTESEVGVKISFTYQDQDYSVERPINKNTLYEDDGVWRFKVAIVELPTDAYNVEFTVQTYVQLTADAEKEYSLQTVTTSLAALASEAKSLGGNLPIYDEIIAEAAKDYDIAQESIEVTVAQAKRVAFTNTTVTYAQYEIEDDEIAYVDESGRVLGLSVGTTTLKTTIAGVEKTCDVVVTECAPQTTFRTVTEELIKESFYKVTSSISTEIIMMNAGLYFDDEVLSAVQIVGENAYPVFYDTETRTLDGLQLGENTELIFYTESACYKTKLNVYTLVLQQADDLNVMTEILEANKVPVPVLYSKDGVGVKYEAYKSDGFFVLGNSFEYAPEGSSKWFSSSFVMRCDTAWYSVPEDIGFVGTFDGKGYTISSLPIGAGSKIIQEDPNSKEDFSDVTKEYSSGLFTIVGKAAVIRNVNLEVSFRTSGHLGGIFGHQILGTLHNISIKTIPLYDNMTSAGSAQARGLFARYVQSSATLKNIVFNMETPAALGGGSVGLIGEQVKDDCTIVGFYAFGGRIVDGERTTYTEYLWSRTRMYNSYTQNAINNSGGYAAYFLTASDYANNVWTYKDGAPPSKNTTQPRPDQFHNAKEYIEQNFNNEYDVWMFNTADGIPVVRHPNER